MKSSELKQLIKEEIDKVLKEVKEPYSQASDKAKDLMKQLEDLAFSGEIGNRDIDELKARLRSARSKMFATKRSPEDRQAALAKAAATREKSKQQAADIRARMDKEEREEQERRDNNFLPIEIVKMGVSVRSLQNQLGDLVQYYRVEDTPDYEYPNQQSLILISKYKKLQLPNAKDAWDVLDN